MKNFVAFVLLAFLFFSHSLRSQNKFSVLQFNVWQEGTKVEDGLLKITNVIDSLQPDAVTFSEVRNYEGEDWISKLINSLKDKGSEYFGGYVAGDVGLISKYPIKDSKVIFDDTKIDAGSIVAYLIDVNGKKIWVCPGHLDYKYYAVYLPRGYKGGIPDWGMIDDGNGNPQSVVSVNTIIAYNKLSSKDEAIKAFISFANLNKDTPVIFGVDLNGASHRDWTERTKDSFDHHGMVIPWNNTLALENAGFTDAYRHVFPDEVNYPGITWPAHPTDYEKQVSWTPKADERERIDYIFYRGKGLSAQKAYLVGSKISYSHGKPVSMDTFKDQWLLEDEPWPSDHFGVLIEFSIEK